MQITTVGNYAISLGTLIALLVLVGVIVLWLISQIDPRLALFIAALALSRLL